MYKKYTKCIFLILDQNTKRESGRKVQVGNIAAGKVRNMFSHGRRHGGMFQTERLFKTCCVDINGCLLSIFCQCLISLITRYTANSD